MDNVQIIAILGSAVLLVIIIDLIRRGGLKEKYSLLWITASVVILLFCVWRDLLHIVSAWLGIFYPPSFIFLLAFIFLTFIILHFSVVISSLSEANKRLAQEIAFLKMKERGEE
jgi:hypothetical protein